MTTPTPQGGFAQQLARFRRDHAPRQITLNGTQWSYHVAGNGVRHVLLIPGAVGGGELFFLLVEELSARYRVLATDLPPVGTVRQFLDGLRSILDTERASHVSVLGASYGGLLAQALVRDTPERFDALILSHTGPLLPEQVRANRRAAKIVPYVPLALTRPLLKGLVWLLLRKTPERKFWVAYFREILDQVDSELLTTRYPELSFGGFSKKQHNFASRIGPVGNVLSDDLSPITIPAGAVPRLAAVASGMTESSAWTLIIHMVTRRSRKTARYLDPLHWLGAFQNSYGLVDGQHALVRDHSDLAWTLE